MKEVRDRGFDRVLLESDCQHLINVILKETEWPALAPELDDINLLGARFQNAVFSHVSRFFLSPCGLLSKRRTITSSNLLRCKRYGSPRPALVASLIEPE